MRTGKCVLAACAAILLAGAMSRAGAVCGDGVRDGTEQCDGTDLGGETCADVTSGFVHGGTLACNPDCTFNTDGCRQAFIQLSRFTPGLRFPYGLLRFLRDSFWSSRVKTHG